MPTEDEILLKIKAIDEGALALMERLKESHEALRRARASGDKEAVTAAKRVSNALNEQVRTYEDQARTMKRALRDEQHMMKKNAEEGTRTKRQQLGEEVVISKSRQKVITEEQRVMQAKLRDEREAHSINNRMIKEQMELVRQRIRQEMEAANILRQMRRDELNNTRAQAKAQQQAAREQARQQRDILKAQTQAQAQSLRTQRQQQVAQQRAAAAAQRANAVAISSYRSQQNAVNALTQRILALVAAYAGFRAIRNLIDEGIKFNEVIETNTLGIAALITAQSKLTDQSGRLLTGTEALDGAMVLATDQIAKLRIQGIRTAATTEQLVDAFQQAVGAGIAVGLTLDQIRIFTVRSTQAAAALGLPMHQINQEVRSILDGTIDRNSRVAKALQLTNAEVKLAREQGRLAEFLLEKFEAFEIAGERAVGTWKVLVSNMREAVQVFSGDSIRPMWERVRDSGVAALREVFDFDTARIHKQFQGILGANQAIFREIGLAIADGIRFAVEAAQDLSIWFEKNKQGVQEVASAVGTLVREVGLLLAAIVGMPVDLAKSGAEVGALVVLLRAATGFVTVIKENVELIAVIITFFLLIGGIAAAFASAPVFATVVAVTALLGVVRAFMEVDRQVRIEEARRQVVRGEELETVFRLIGRYDELTKQMREGKIKGKELEAVQRELEIVTSELVKVAPQYSNILATYATNAKKAAEELRNLANAERDLILADLSRAQGLRVVAQLNLQKAEEAQALVKRQTEGADLAGVAAIAHEEKKVRELTIQYEVLDTTVRSLEEAYKRAGTASEIPSAPTIAPTDRPDKTIQEQIRNDEVEANRGTIARTRARVKKETEILENQYRNNLITAKDYYTKLATLQTQVIDAEIVLRRVRIASTTDIGKRDQALQEIQGFEEERVRIIADNNQKIVEEDKKLAEERAEVHMALLEAEGRTAEARAIQLAQQYKEALGRALREGDKDTEASIGRIVALETAKARFEELIRIVEQAEARTRHGLEEIQTLVDAGAITETEAIERINKLRVEQADRINSVIAELERLRPLLAANPEAVAEIDTIILKYRQLQIEIAKTKDLMARLREATRASLKEGMADAIQGLIAGTHNISEAFSEMANQVIVAIARIIAEMVAATIVAQIFKSAAGFAGGGEVDKASRVMGQAGGGLIQGPGTGTSDSILARLSHGEYVMPARTVQEYGIEFFDAIRDSRSRTVIRRGMPNYAAGGPVAATNGGSGMSRLFVDLSPDLMARELESSRTQKAQIRNASYNRKAFRRALGID